MIYANHRNESKCVRFCKNYSDNGDGGVMGVPIKFFDKYNPE